MVHHNSRHYAPPQRSAFENKSSSMYTASALGAFCSRGEALDSCKRYYSGDFKRADSWDMAGGSHAVIYNCNEAGCKMKLRLVFDMRSPGPNKWHVQVHKFHHSHSHETSIDDISERGIPEVFKGVIRACNESLALIDGRTALTATEAMTAIRSQYRNDPTYADLFLSSNSDSLRTKVKRYLDYERAKSRSGSIVTVSDITHFIDRMKPLIPRGYVASDDYKTPEAFAEALGCDIDEMFALPIPASEAQRLKAKYVSSDDADSIYQTVVLVTPATLFTMLEQTKNFPSGSHLIQVDATSNATHDGRQILVFGCHDVRFRESQSRVTMSLHPFGYAVAPGERKVCVGFSIDLFRHYFSLFFGKRLSFDWGGLDHSWPIRSGVSVGTDKPNIGILMCFFHVMKIIRARGDDAPYSKITFEKPSERIKFQDKVLAIFSKLHLCRTRPQMDAAFQLALEFCRTCSQNGYADHIEKTFEGEWLNFFFSASGQQGVTPSGSPLESHNGVIKGHKGSNGIIQLNRTLHNCLTEQMPRLLSHASFYLCGAALLPSSNPSKVVETCAGLMNANVDMLELAPGKWATNAPWATLLPITKQRLDSYDEGERGVFVREPAMSAVEAIASLVNSTETFCIVTRQEDGSLLGNCKLCYSILTCPGCVLVKDAYQELVPPLTVRFSQVSTLRSSGRPQEKGLGGLAARQINVNTAVLTMNKEEYLQCLHDGTLRSVCSMMRVKTLKPRAGVRRTSKSKRRLPRAALLSGLRNKLSRNQDRSTLSQLSDEESDLEEDDDTVALVLETRKRKADAKHT
jgi:hypothetical protein